MRLFLLVLLFAPVLAAQGYLAEEIVNDFQSKNIISLGQGLTSSFVPNTDEGVAPAPLYFSFPFLGGSYSTCNVSTNGFISFDQLASAFPTAPGSIPDSTVPNNFIAAYWKDMGRNPLSQNSSCVLYYTETAGGMGNWEFRVQWNDWPDQGQTAQSAMNTVVLCMYEATGVIEIHFGQLSSTYGFCCGIEDASGTTGYAAPNGWQVSSAPTMAYRFSPIVTPLQITTTNPLPDGTEGTAYSIQFSAAGGTAPYTWQPAGLGTGTPPPAGWVLDTTGLLTAPATLVVPGTVNFDIILFDSASGFVQGNFTLTVNAATGGPGPGPGPAPTPGATAGSGGGGGCSAGAAITPWCLAPLVVLLRRRRK